ncbi:transposase domain-containing protein [Sorangium sp. So ce394]
MPHFCLPCSSPAALRRRRPRSQLARRSPPRASRATIFGPCRMHGGNPLAWATDVIGKLQAGWPRDRLDELLPDALARSSRPAPSAGDADAT